MRSRVLFTSCAVSPAPNGSTEFLAWKRFVIPLHFATYLKGAHHSGPDLDVAKNGLQPMLAIAIMLDSWIQSGPAGTAVPRVGKLGANSTLRMSVR